MNIKVEEVKSVSLEGNLKAFVDITLADIIAVNACTVMEGKNGFFVNLPRRIGRDGRWADVVVIHDEMIRARITAAVLEAYRAKIGA